MKALLFLITSISLMAAGKCSKYRPTPPDKSPLIRLETHGCRGYCPTYVLLFRNDGILEYEGVRNMVKMGLDTAELSSAELKRLQSAVKELNLWQYPQRFESQIADAPPSTLRVFDGDKYYEVVGAMERPKPILEFENLLKDLAEAHGIKVKEGINPYQAPANQQELLVKFKAEVNPGNFLMKFEEIKLRIVRRVSAENIWIIGFNPDQITEKQLIEMLSGMDGVLEAVANKKK